MSNELDRFLEQYLNGLEDQVRLEKLNDTEGIYISPLAVIGTKYNLDSQNIISLNDKIRKWARSNQRRTSRKIKQNLMSCAFMSMFFRLNRIKWFLGYFPDRIDKELTELVSSEDGCENVENRLLKEYETYDQSNFSYVLDHLAPDYDLFLHTTDKDFAMEKKIPYDDWIRMRKRFFRYESKNNTENLFLKNINKMIYRPTVECLEEICNRKLSNLYDDVSSTQIHLIKRYFQNLIEVVKKSEEGPGSFKIIRYPMPSEDPEFVEKYKNLLGKHINNDENLDLALKNGLNDIEKEAFVKFLAEEADDNPLISFLLSDPDLSKEYFGRFSKENPTMHAVCLLSIYSILQKPISVFDPFVGNRKDLSAKYLPFIKNHFITIKPYKGYKLQIPK